MEIRRTITKKLIKYAQKLINRAYERNGMTDKLLEQQVKLNELRHKYDINETDDEFVQ